MSSVRLPGKVLADVGGKPMLEVLLTRLSAAKLVNQIVVATSSEESDNPVAVLAETLGLLVYRGSLVDVRSRYLDVGHITRADVLVRITGDCPMVDPDLVDELVENFFTGEFDYVSNVNPPTYPDGLDVEVFSFASFENSIPTDISSTAIEHVTPALRASRFRHFNLKSHKDYSHLRWTVDNPRDLSVIRNVFTHFAPRIDFGWESVVDLYEQKPELFRENSMDSRNRGQIQGTGQKLWERAKQLIPGGNMLLSKRAEMFLPDHWPAYYSKAEGCRVWDLDGKEYIDMATMGVGTNILGYRNPIVDEAVKRAIDSGTMSTLNSPEEVYLAERLLEINPWAHKVKLARSGGEANAVAIRIARAASGKDKVAICGYHGWHDWYLSANLSDDQSLDGHLLPGLEPRGVPRALAGSVVTFPYNDIAALEQIVSAGDVGVIKMEVIRSEPPRQGFLENVRQLATKNGIVLVFDECTSGFRETFGGIHQKYRVEPDMAVFGKALGNGYPITAVVGKSEVMEAAQSTFISSTFWTDRVGPAAALATLDEMERVKSWELISESGMEIQSFWHKSFIDFPIDIFFTGIPSLAGFASMDQRFGLLKTYLTQELLSRGFLASNIIYSSIAHTASDRNAYFDVFSTVLENAKAATIDGSLEKRLLGPTSHVGFKRLN
jgi:glutamate-1-semialdehyde 2,1-aminomutase